MHDHMIDLIKPICQKPNPHLASVTIFYTFGIEAWVTENNPKYVNRIIKQLKAVDKANNFDKNFDTCKATYGSMPPHTTANPTIQWMYISRSFCYAYKFDLVTNGLSIVYNIILYNKEFLYSHQDIVMKKSSNFPDENKHLADSEVLLPVLLDFFQKDPLINLKIFLKNAAFYTSKICIAFFGEICLKKFTPFPLKLSMKENGYVFNEEGSKSH